MRLGSLTKRGDLANHGPPTKAKGSFNCDMSALISDFMHSGSQEEGTAKRGENFEVGVFCALCH